MRALDRNANPRIEARIAPTDVDPRDQPTAASRLDPVAAIILDNGDAHGAAHAAETR